MNRILTFAFSLFLLQPPSLLLSQDKQKWMTGIEAGFDFSACQEPGEDYIREDRTLYGSGNAMSSLQALMNRTHFGVRRELFLKDGRYGLSAGLRIAKSETTLGKNDYWGESSQYFFLLYKQDGLTTSYLRVKSMEEKCLYLGIPLEIRVFPYPAEGKQIYFKAGTEVNFLLNSDVHVSFYDPGMNRYAADTEDMPEKPAAVESRLYGAIGINFPREEKADIILELALPVLYLTTKSSGLADPVFATGLNVSMMFPF
ncbi:MAG: hypothetical protein U0T82_12075 [Bacteroidales bacterium]